jgi:iron complex transport system ATP-binding protein
VVIRAENVSFRYGRSAAVLRDVSVDVREGEVLAIAGPNGSGKSTLVSLLDGLLAPESGRVLLGERSLQSIPRREIARSVGFVAQSAEFHFPLTVLEYVLQGRFAHGHLLGFETDHDVEAASRALQMTGAESFAARHLDELSGGERQRVMVARALAQEPRVLLLDEPTANLDIAHQIRILALVRSLAHGCRMAVAVVTHDLNLAAEFADRVVLLADGQVRGCGTPQETLTPERLESVFGTPVLVDANPVTGAPRITVLAGSDPHGALPAEQIGEQFQ